jgi:hypothetical protein
MPGFHALSLTAPSGENRTQCHSKCGPKGNANRRLMRRGTHRRTDRNANRYPNAEFHRSCEGFDLDASPCDGSAATGSARRYADAPAGSSNR